MSQGRVSDGSPKSEKNEPVEISGLDPRYECPICLSCLKDTILTSCGHKFCSDCINNWMKNKGETCPIDGKKLNRLSDLFLDNHTNREIMSQTAVCKICNEEINLYKLDGHAAIHTNNIPLEDSRKCPFRDIGCLLEVSVDKMAEHIESQMHHHLTLMYEAHMKLEGNLTKDFRRCSDTLAEETKFWEPSSKDKGKEGNDVLQSDALIRSLYERIIILEQRGHEQDAHLQKLKGQVSKLEAKFSDISLRYCFGHYLWNVDKFTTKLKSNQRFWYSSGFYTSPTGYQVCCRINISPPGKDHIAILIHLMKSPHDASLEWPFSGRLTLALIHPTDSSLTVKETCVTRPDLEAFHRPTHDFNYKAFGYPKFISVADILEKGFLSNDTLTVKIDIQCI